MSTADTVFYFAICPLALAWCVYHAVCIVREFRGRSRLRPGRFPNSRLRQGNGGQSSGASLGVLLSLSGVLEVD